MLGCEGGCISTVRIKTQTETLTSPFSPWIDGPKSKGKASASSWPRKLQSSISPKMMQFGRNVWFLQSFVWTSWDGEEMETSQQAENLKASSLYALLYSIWCVKKMLHDLGYGNYFKLGICRLQIGQEKRKKAQKLRRTSGWEEERLKDLRISKARPSWVASNVFFFGFM